MKKATKQELLEQALEQTEKYFNLVWYARSGKNLHIPAVIKEREKIEMKYPVEINLLTSKEGDWYHGFNSGCLASFRFILTSFEDSVEEAYEMFPELDS